jgi:hypothetical protein
MVVVVLDFQESPYYFCNGYTNFHLVQHSFESAVYKTSLAPTSLPAVAFFCLFNNHHSTSCEAISNYGFNLHFPDD